MQIAWTFFTYGDLRNDVRAARLTGDVRARREARELIHVDSRARWVRDGLEYEGRGGVVVGLIALLLWIVDSTVPREEMWPWLAGIYELLAVLQMVAALGMPIVAVLAPVGWVVAAVYIGRDETPGAEFLIRPHRDDADS